ncbi:ribosome small subunit-dependent GTPase A [Paenibacillus sp. 1P07SE]|uniref:ribosome small subunit-dependent GTPase A n=1 Tax=Paenibacillus sp. 1P07SE TaxID=3132209 RepID=UPI0039A6CC13
MSNNGMEQIGRIVKALSGYYYVRPEQGGAAEPTLQCRARGIFKKRGESPLVGDLVAYEPTENGEGAVNRILPRTTELVRPPVANVELAVLVFSVTEPTLNLQLLDKFLAHVEHAGLQPIICLSKLDLAAKDGTGADTLADIERIYRPIGYEIYSTSSLRHEGTGELEARLAGRLSVFAGQSGVGKSSLLNSIVPGLELHTAAISNKLGRGKHTTRHVELIGIAGGGYVADTPGFSQLDFQELGVDELSGCFPEFRERAGACKFRGCTHTHEPFCAVLEALENGEISPSRHEHYLLFLAEMKDKKRRY